MAGLNCVVVTPEETSVDEKADFVALPMFDGELGVLPGHSPLIGRLGCGEMRVRNGSHVAKFFINGGFVQIADNVVSVLCNRATPVSELDADAARQQLDAANQMKPKTEDEFDHRDRMVEQARAQLRMLQRD